jgi:hypothetical protein
MLFDGEDDPSCKRTCAMLLVSGEGIEASEVTSAFGIAATETATAGECVGWRVSSESQVLSTNLERHIDWLLNQIEDKISVIQELKQRNCQVDMYCFWQGHGTSNDVGPFITSYTLRRVADFHLNMIFAFRCSEPRKVAETAQLPSLQ